MEIELNMFQKIREKPALYLGKISLSLLNAFMNGYSFRQYEIDGEKRFTNDQKDFQSYVQEHYDIKLTTKGWCTIICENSLNEEEAFYKFYELWDKFIGK